MTVLAFMLVAGLVASSLLTTIYSLTRASGAPDTDIARTITAALSSDLSPNVFGKFTASPGTYLPTVSGSSSGFTDSGNVQSSDDSYATGTGVAGWVDHVVISKVLVAGTDQDYGEKVELYNPTSYSIDLSNWVLDTPTSATDATVDTGKVIPAHGFFTIGDNGSDDNETITLGNSNSSENIRLSAGGSVVDTLGYGTAAAYEGTVASNLTDTTAPDIQMFERKARSNSDATSMAAGGADVDKGNGYDTNNNSNDFVALTATAPKLSTDAVEHPGWLTENDNIWAGGFPIGTGTIAEVKLRAEYKASAAWTNDYLVFKYSLDGGTTFGSATTSFTPNSTSDTMALLDITTDTSVNGGAWEWDDIDNLRIYLIYDINGTSDGENVYIDAMWADITIAAFDFSVSAFPDNLSMVRGETKTSTIRVSQVSGTPGTVNLSGAWVDTAPTGVTASLSTASGTPTFESTLTVSVSSAATGGSFIYRVTGTGGGLTREANIRVDVNVGLALTLTTNKENYEQSDNVQISGRVKDPKDNPVTSGTATIKFTNENWSVQANVGIQNGAYSHSYQISYGDPTGTWTITVTAVDSLNNTGTITKDIGVGTKPTTDYFFVTIYEPENGAGYERGKTIHFSINITKDGVAVENAIVTVTTPTGAKYPLGELAPGLYTADYTLGLDENLGAWTVTVEGMKTLESGRTQAGGNFVIVEVKPASLAIALLSPGNRVEIGEQVEIKAEVRHPDGSPVVGAVVTAKTPAGENIILVHEGAGVYSQTYTVTPEDNRSWNLTITVQDSYGNSGSLLGTTVEIVPRGLGGILVAYWWAFLAIFCAVGVTSAYLARRFMLIRKLRLVRKEMREIPRLKKEVMIKYFKEGSIERETYDELMDKHDMRMGELRKQEELLSAKVEKRKRVKRGKRTG